MAESLTVYCGSCDYDEVTTLAIKWCTDCDEGFCEQCVKGHKISRKLIGHHTISVEDYTKIKSLTQNQLCSQHDKTIDFFCPHHDKLLCMKCLQLSHSSCNEVAAVKDVASEVKDSAAVFDTECQLKEVLDNIERGIEEINIFVEDKSSAIIVKKEIKKIREKINRKLEQIEHNLLKDLKFKQREINKEIEQLTVKLLQQKKEMQEMKDKIYAVRNCASDEIIFISMRMLSENLMTEKKKVKKLFSDITKYEIRFRPDLSIFFNLDSIGDLEIKTLRKGIHYTEGKFKQSQVPVSSDDADSSDYYLED